MKISMKNHLFKNCLQKIRGRRTFASIEKSFDKKKVEEFKEKGYTIIPKVFSPDYIEELRSEIETLCSKVSPEEIKSVFDAEHFESDDYFNESGDKIRYFLEKDAWDENKNLKYPLKDCLNKIGHALHDLNPKFKEFSYSKEIKYIVQNLGYLAPILVQSMYIFKNRRIGGEVPPHTDNTYIRTKPLSCTGLWIAFDDATVENGCLWGLPGSHKTPTDYFMKLKKDKEGKSKTYYEPATPPKYELKDPVPLEAEKGTVVLLHGDFVHFSYHNKSPQQRHAYTLHLVESRNHIWEHDNWLQRKDIPFNFLYDTQSRI